MLSVRVTVCGTKSSDGNAFCLPRTIRMVKAAPDFFSKLQKILLSTNKAGSAAGEATPCFCIKIRQVQRLAAMWSW